MPFGIQIALAFAIGGGLGLFIGWLLGGRNQTVAPSDARLENELRQQLTQRDLELRSEREQANANAARLEKRSGEMDAELTFLKEQLATERQQIKTIQETFRKEFEAISNKLIAENTSSFNRQSSENLENVLKPFKDNLAEFKTSLDATRQETVAHSTLLKNEIGRIGAEAANLSKALKGDVKVLGNWGENMLDQILDKSGLQQEFHYRRQHGAKDLEGDQRFLDVIVDLPEKRNLVIDSKVSLRSYEEFVNASDDAAKVAGLERHVEALRKHFRDLGAKRYQNIHGINTPDFVLMYVPIEAAFFAAILREPGLFAEALDHNVVLITNSTLLATLRTVAHVWRLADQQKHVLEIADRGGKLYDKFVGFVEDMQSVGDSLGKARKAWEDASTKLHTGSGNLVSQTEKLKQLGAKAAKSLPTALLEKTSEEAPASDSTLRVSPS
ncbi:MAG TPA: DNA recombination protein RmuC [Verrucomicrobiae bacterium]|jgi:DNA recombination protein RmuC|nr:DNA recombination protein RmuC [Verrucomicrobiae bacterium]